MAIALLGSWFLCDPSGGAAGASTSGLPLGELLFAAGYDPEAEDCLDYAVYIDSSRLQSGVSILPWEVIPLDITI